MIVVGVIAIIMFAAAVWAVMYPASCAQRLNLCSAGANPMDMMVRVDEPLPLLESSSALDSAHLRTGTAFVDSRNKAIVGATGLSLAPATYAMRNAAGLRTGSLLVDKNGMMVLAATGASGLIGAGAPLQPFGEAPPMWSSSASEDQGSIAGSAFPGGSMAATDRLAGHKRANSMRIQQIYNIEGTKKNQIGVQSNLMDMTLILAGVEKPNPVADPERSRLEQPSNHPRSIEGAAIAAETRANITASPMRYLNR